jgi:hypothetical protein
MKTMTLAIAAALAAGTLAHAQEAVQWRVKDGGNGHWYQLRVPTGASLTWEEARDAAIASGGHLATITSEAESTFVLSASQSLSGWRPLDSNLQYCVGPWLGGFQPPGSPEPSGGWRWVTDEPWDWTNWWAPANEPNNGCGGGENYLHWLSQGSIVPSDWWNDAVFPDQCGSLGPKSYVIEWSADCNGDGIVDYGQILDGTFADLNTNGVPDTCECIADLTGNGEVNGADISIILGFWGKVPEPLPSADINQDGNVDGLDLAVLLGSWGPCQ